MEVIYATNPLSDALLMWREDNYSERYLNRGREGWASRWARNLWQRLSASDAIENAAHHTGVMGEGL